MHTYKMTLDFPLALIEFLARVGSVISITLLALLFWGEAFNPSQVAPREWIGLFFFPFGVVVGMIVAWRKEGWGASITLGSLVAFYVVYGFLLRSHLGGWAFIVFASPAFLFLLHWVFRHDRKVF